MPSASPCPQTLEAELSKQYTAAVAFAAHASLHLPLSVTAVEPPELPALSAQPPISTPHQHASSVLPFLPASEPILCLPLAVPSVASPPSPLSLLLASAPFLPIAHPA